jgi:murein DD-endopeptidase MepM/ murein hydrolase activator NlpD
MMSGDPLDKLSQVIKQLNSGITKLNTSLDKTAAKGSKAANAVTGSDKFSGSTKMMDGTLASFSGMDRAQFRNTRNFLSNGLGLTPMQATVGTSMLGNAGKVMGGLNAMMPDLGATFSRASGYYNAMVASGSRMSRGAIETQVQSAIGKGNQTGIGSDMEAASYLMGRGMTAGTATFKQTLRTVGGLSQLTGMSNAAAATAVEGLGSGAGSSNLLRNFGIYTSNPATGKESSPQQIISQIKGRLTQGRGKYTTKDVNDSLRKGALGVTLQNSGLSQDQQAMVMQSILGDATDSKTGPINLDSRKSMENAAKKQGGNPMAPFMAIYGSKNKAMQNAEGSYQSGADAAAGALSALNDAAGALAGTFGALNAAAGTFMGDGAGAGAAGAIGGVANIAQTAMMAKTMGFGGSAGGGFTGIGGKLGGAAGKFASKATSGMSGLFKPGMAGMKSTMAAGGVMAAVNVLADTPGNIEATNQGKGGSAWGKTAGETVGGLAGAAIGQTLIPIPVVGAMIGGMVGSWAGGALGQAIGSNFDVKDPSGAGGDEAPTPPTPVTSAGGNTQQGVGNNGRVSLIPPVNGKLGDRFGAMASYRKHPHRGQDWSVPTGTTVVACADGEVIATNTSGELGKMVQIRHEGNYITQYCHLSNNSMVSVGDKVKQGKVVAQSGNTGTATTGAHLHLALMRNGSYLDPMAYMGGAGTPPAQDPTSGGTSTDPSTSAGGDQGATTGDTLPVASAGSSALSVGASGVSASGANLAGQIGGATSSTGGGGEGTIPGLDPQQPKGILASSIKSNNHAQGNGNNVTIHLTIGQASESEARKFAKLVKGYLEEDNRLTSIGRG